MTKNQISDSGYFPNTTFVPGRHYDLFGVGAVVQGASSVIGATIQANAAKHAADLANQQATAGLDFNKDVFNTQQSNIAPWLQSGRAALDQLNAGTAPGGRFSQGYGKTFDPGTYTAPSPFHFDSFKAPTGVDEQNDPGYQFRLSEGQKALERSSAAKGTATGGAALKAAARYGQGYSSNEYGNVYNRALSGFQTNFGSALNSYATNAQTGLNAFNSNAAVGANAFNTNYNVWSGDTNAQYNRLASLAGVGQTANAQLGQAGQAAAGNNTAITGNLGSTLANLTTGAGNSISAGFVGAGNAVNNGINGYQNSQLLQQILGRSGYASTANGGIPNNGYYGSGYSGGGASGGTGLSYDEYGNAIGG